MSIREGYRRCIGQYAEYPGSYAWPEYEYKCPECGKWHREGSDITTVFNDGTEGMLCPSCAKEAETEFHSGEVMQVNLNDPTALWDKFGSVTINDDDQIDEPFLHFPIGTNRFDVWHWFEKTFPNFSVQEQLTNKGKKMTSSANRKFVNPDYFYVGQTIYIPALWYIKDANPTAGIPCMVTAAHGNHAQIENKKYGVNTLVSKFSCYHEVVSDDRKRE